QSAGGPAAGQARAAARRSALHAPDRRRNRARALNPLRILFAALGIFLSVACCAQTDERKQLAFDTIERNAAQLALIGDSLYYFGELGMQEVESARFLKETLEAPGPQLATGAPRFPPHPRAPRPPRPPHLLPPPAPP